MNEFFKSFLYYSSLLRVKTPRTLEPGAEKDRFVAIQPATDPIYQGVAVNSAIKPEAVGATWYPSPLTREDVDAQVPVVLHFHGGAFVIGEGRDASCAYGANLLTSNTAAKVFAVDYRLSSNPGGQFPAALQDAITAYGYVLRCGITSSRIAISGDSAGANIVVALLRYISQPEQYLPSPGAALLWSPWLDLDSNPRAQDIDHHVFSKTDYLSNAFISWGIQAYLPKSMKISDPYISPMDHPFPSRTPIWIQVGGVEVLHSQSAMFAQSMGKVKGNVVEIHVEPYANHDIFLLGGQSGFDAEASKCAKLAARFLEKSGLRR
ncbi:MAG: hypothetical protein Q9187_007042 [Circinaria calcarea]